MGKTTNPQNLTAPDAVRSRSTYDLANVTQALAKEFWLELKAYPEGTARSLWFEIENHGWKRLDNPSDGIQNAVIAAFTRRNKHDVKVWFEENKEPILGLVVLSDFSRE